MKLEEELFKNNVQNCFFFFQFMFILKGMFKYLHQKLTERRFAQLFPPLSSSLKNSKSSSRLCFVIRK